MGGYNYAGGGEANNGSSSISAIDSFAARVSARIHQFEGEHHTRFGAHQQALAFRAQQQGAAAAAATAGTTIRNNNMGISATDRARMSAAAAAAAVASSHESAPKPIDVAPAMVVSAHDRRAQDNYFLRLAAETQQRYCMFVPALVQLRSAPSSLSLLSSPLGSGHGEGYEEEQGEHDDLTGQHHPHHAAARGDNDDAAHGVRHEQHAFTDLGALGQTHNLDSNSA
jgi:hypothetical protein